MRLRNLLTASSAALALAVSAAPAAAQEVGGHITIGIGVPGYSTYDRNHNGIDDRYEYSNYQYGYAYPYGYNNYNTYSPFSWALGARRGYGACGWNKTEVIPTGLRTSAGRIVVMKDRGVRGIPYGARLHGERFSARSSRICVNTNELRSNRIAFVHDVNGNNRFDYRDTLGQMSYTASYGYRNQPTMVVKFNY
jgi:hypothetical protein